MKSNEIVIKNTLADIHDGGLIVMDLNNDGTFGEEKLMDMTQVIESINTPLWGQHRIVDNNNKIIFEEDFKLNSYLEKMPHGIVDKKRPGIGATTLEIKSNRNSIIVVPTKILAHNKAIQHSHTCYVGSKIISYFDTNYGGRTEINEYLQRFSNTIKKFIVVADSLNILIEELEKKENDLYNNYFFMVDEVDLMQSDSTFRPSLENVMDYYFKFNVKKRCLVTATMKEFSNPLLKYECKFDLTDFKPRRNIQICHTNNIQLCIKNMIENNDENKLLIAYNSVSKAKAVIYSLSEELQRECGILCSDASEKEAGVFYSKLSNLNQLTKKISFMTCSYFAGVDINDSYHLLTVSDATRFFQILSTDKMTQISGRCRIEGGLLSETIIYNTPKKNHRFRKKDYTSKILKMAENVLELYQVMDKIQDSNEDITPVFNLVRNAIKDKATYSVLGESIALTRKNISGQMVPAYFNIDAIAERMLLDSGFYSLKNMLPEELMLENDVTILPDFISEQDPELEIAITKSKEESKLMYDEQLKLVVHDLRQLYHSDEINKDSLKKLRRKLMRNAQIFIDRFEILHEYVDFEKLIELLWEIRAENNKAFRSINNAVMLWALDENHPFIVHLKHEFELNKQYSANEIHQKLTPAIQYHLFKQIRPRSSVSLLKAYFKVERPRNKYKITGTNPYDFQEKKKLIKVDENLHKYLQIHTYQPTDKKTEKAFEIIATL